MLSRENGPASQKARPRSNPRWRTEAIATRGAHRRLTAEHEERALVHPLADRAEGLLDDLAAECSVTPNAGPQNTQQVLLRYFKPSGAGKAAGILICSMFTTSFSQSQTLRERYDRWCCSNANRYQRIQDYLA